MTSYWHVKRAGLYLEAPLGSGRWTDDRDGRAVSFLLLGHARQHALMHPGSKVVRMGPKSEST